MKIAGLGVLIVVLVGLFWPISDNVGPPGDVVVEEFELSIGESTVVLAVHQGEESLFSMLVLHDDENTAVEAGRAFLEEHGGRLVELRAQGERRVSFLLGGRSFDFDPNRVFTDHGVRATLQPEAEDVTIFATQTFADSLLAIYAPHDVIVTLHNNTPDNYSARSYAQGGEYESDAAAVHLEDGVDPDDFFFVTDEDLYHALRADDFNVVLQNNASVTDDGSLSVWAAQNDFLYVNVEAEHGHLDQQKEMIEGLEFLLRMLEHRHHTH